MAFWKRVARRLFSNALLPQKERHLANAFVAVIVFLAGSCLLVMGDYLAGLMICVFSIIYLLASLIVFKRVCGVVGPGIGEGYLLSEIMLTLSMYGLMMANLLVAYSSYIYGNSRVGVVVLLLSFAVQSFLLWKHRFFFLAVVLLVGAVLIELG